MTRSRKVKAERWRGLRSTRHLGRRILILYAITAAAVAAVFSTALVINWISTLTLTAVDEQSIRTYRNLAALQVAESGGTDQLIIFLATGDSTALAQYRAMITKRQQAYEQLANGANEGGTSAAVAALQPSLIALDTIADRSIAARQAGTPDPVSGWRGASIEGRETLAVQLAAIARAEEGVHAAAINEAERTRTLTIILTFLFAGATALLGLWITRRVILNITLPLEALANAAAAIGAGRLETRVAPGLAAEFDMLGGVMNAMAARLAESLGELQAALAVTERRNGELRLLSEVGDALDSSLDLDLIVERSLNVVLTTFAARDGVILLYDEAGESWRWHKTVSEKVEGQRAARARALQHALGEPSIGREPVTVITINGDMDEVQEAFAIIPLGAAVRTHGVLALFADAAWSPDSRERALLLQVGGQIARAVENVQLYAAEKGRSAEAGMLAQMAQLTTGTLDLDRLARLIARYAVHVLGVERCIIGFFDPRGEAKGRGMLQRLYQYGFQPQQAALVEGERASL